MATKSASWENLFKPLGDRILVERESVSNTTPSGLIIIPDTVAQQSNNQGKVLSVGAGTYSSKGLLRKLDVKVGDTILFSNYAGTDVKLNGTEVLILKEADVLGVINS